MNTAMLKTVELYKRNDWVIENLYNEEESKEYQACRFDLVGLENQRQCHIIYRQAKITPKKVGQFVTFWKRKKAESPIEPFHEDNEFDFYVIDVKCEDKFGQFVFPKSALIKRGIVSTSSREGKRGFRVYPKWDIPTSKQAIKTQQWQLEYFYEIVSDGMGKFKDFYGLDY